MNLSFVRPDSVFPNINKFTCHNQDCELPSDQCPINIAIQANQRASVCVYVEVLFNGTQKSPLLLCSSGGDCEQVMKNDPILIESNSKYWMYDSKALARHERRNHQIFW
jgi:hypothetical protein